MSQAFINDFAQFAFTFVFIIAFRLIVLQSKFEEEMKPLNLVIAALSAIAGMWIAKVVLA